MTRGAARRRLRVRRKRKGDSVAEVAGDCSEVAVEASGEAGGEVIGEFGGCVVETVAGAAVFAALLFVPSFLLMA